MDQSSGSNRRWTKESVIDEIKKSSEFSAKYVQRHRPDLYGAAVRHFGSWKNAVEASGLDYLTARKNKPFGFWSRDTVVESIRSLDKKHSASVRKKHADLYNAALRVFGSWESAVEAAGFSYEEIQQGQKKTPSEDM